MQVAASLGQALAGAVASRDFATLSQWFDDQARLRALLPAETVEVVGNEAVVAQFTDWFATFDTVSLVGSGCDLVGDRLQVGYRLELTRGGRRWLCAQESFCRISSGRIVAMDLVCSGFRPVEG